MTSFETLDFEAFSERAEELMARSRPVKVELGDAFECTMWDVPRLATQAGHNEVTVVRFVDGERAIYGRSRAPKTPMRLVDFVATLQSDQPAGYVAGTAVSPLDPFARDVVLPTSLPAGLRNSVRYTNLWLGPSDTFAPLHYDPLENLVVQISGEKRFLLFEPGLADYYPQPLLSFDGHLSKIVDATHYDAERFPAFDPSRGREVTLEAGQMLYIPFGWWHQVRSLAAVNFAVNFWLAPSLRKLVANPGHSARTVATKIYRRLRRVRL